MRVRLFAAAKSAAGTSEVELEAGTIATISAALVAQYPALAAVLPACSFLIDGLQAGQEPSRTRVEAGSVVDVLPPFAGG